MTDRTPPPVRPKPRRRVALALLTVVCVAGCAYVVVGARRVWPDIVLAARSRDARTTLGLAVAFLQVPAAAAAVALMVRQRVC